MPRISQICSLKAFQTRESYYGSEQPLHWHVRSMRTVHDALPNRLPAARGPPCCLRRLDPALLALLVEGRLPRWSTAPDTDAQTGSRAYWLGRIAPQGAPWKTRAAQAAVTVVCINCARYSHETYRAQQCPIFQASVRPSTPAKTNIVNTHAHVDPVRTGQTRARRSPHPFATFATQSTDCDTPSDGTAPMLGSYFNERRDEGLTACDVH